MGDRAITILDLRGILYRNDQGCLSGDDGSRTRDDLAFPLATTAMAGTTVEGAEACCTTEDRTTVRLELFIDAAFGMAALGRDTVGITGAGQGIPCCCRYSGEGWCDIGTSRRGGAPGEDDKAPD